MESAPSPSFGVLGDRQTRLPAVCSKIMALAGPLSLPFRLTALYVWSVIIAVVWWEGAKSVWITPVAPLTVATAAAVA